MLSLSCLMHSKTITYQLGTNIQEAVFFTNSSYKEEKIENNYLVGGYSYGFQGQEMDDEVKGEGNSYTTEFRQYDPRVGRWLSTDPAFKKYVSLSPYHFVGNNPIWFVEIDGRIFDLGNMSAKEMKDYKAKIEVLKESRIFTYYYNQLDLSDQIITVDMNNVSKRGGSYSPSNRTVNLSNLEGNMVAQELFHAYQDISGFYDSPFPGEDRTTVETEGDIITKYVALESGLGFTTGADVWMVGLNEEYGYFDVPTSDQVNSDKYTELFNEAADNRSNHYFEMIKKDPKALEFAGYAQPNSGTAPLATQKVIKEGGALKLEGPRLENGDYYEE